MRALCVLSLRPLLIYTNRNAYRTQSTVTAVSDQSNHSTNDISSLVLHVWHWMAFVSDKNYQYSTSPPRHTRPMSLFTFKLASSKLFEVSHAHTNKPHCLLKITECQSVWFWFAKFCQRVNIFILYIYLCSVARCYALNLWKHSLRFYKIDYGS